MKDTIVQLNAALKTALEENSSKQAHAGAGGVFHLYAEEKRRMEEQVQSNLLFLSKGWDLLNRGPVNLSLTTLNQTQYPLQL